MRSRIIQSPENPIEPERVVNAVIANITEQANVHGIADYAKTRRSTMFNNYPDLLNIEEACEIMHMSRNTLYELLRNKDIKAFQVNRIWKIPREAVEEYCRRRSGLYKNTP